MSLSHYGKKINRCENKNIFLHRKTDYKLYIFIVYSCKIDMKQQVIIVELPTQKSSKNATLKIARIVVYLIIIFHSQDLLSRNVLSNVPAPKAVSSHTAINRWSDCIGPDRYSHHMIGAGRHVSHPC